MKVEALGEEGVRGGKGKIFGKERKAGAERLGEEGVRGRGIGGRGKIFGEEREVGAERLGEGVRGRGIGEGGKKRDSKEKEDMKDGSRRRKD